MTRVTRLVRRLIGGADRPATRVDAPFDAPFDAALEMSPERDADEREREVEVLREEQARMDDLARRQLRYAEYAWTPPAEGGMKRSDDSDASRESG